MKAKFVVAKSPLPSLPILGSIHQLLSLGSYVRSSGLLQLPYFPDRFDLYELVNRRIGAGVTIDYLEFGVFTGKSMRKWVSMNTAPDSRFVGFDTFTGLPEDWVFASGKLEAGYFSTDGKTPNIDDPRVRFVKGKFQDTLGEFARTFQPRGQLVLHCDADLYSATLFVLATLHDFIKPGTIIVFDEFGSVNEEFRAFIDYTRSYGTKLQPLGWAGRFYEQVAFVVN